MLDAFFGGMLAMLVICCSLLIAILGGEKDECKKQNNVYKCERIYVPVGSDK